MEMKKSETLLANPPEKYVKNKLLKIKSYEKKMC